MSWGAAAGQLLSAYSSSQSSGGGGGGGGEVSSDRTMQTNRNYAPFVFQPVGGDSNPGMTTWQWVAIGGVGLAGLWILTSGGK